MEYAIRDAREEDVTSLVKLCEKHADYERVEYDSVSKAERLREAIFMRPSKLYCKVVEVNGLIVGYTSYTFDFSTWDAQPFLNMDCLYLDPEFRGYGIGGEIMLVLERIAKAHGCANVQWQTPVFNERAIRFYGRLGAKGKNKMRFSLEV